MLKNLLTTSCSRRQSHVDEVARLEAKIAPKINKLERSKRRQADHNAAVLQSEHSAALIDMQQSHAEEAQHLSMEQSVRSKAVASQLSLRENEVSDLQNRLEEAMRERSEFEKRVFELQRAKDSQIAEVKLTLARKDREHLEQLKAIRDDHDESSSSAIEQAVAKAVAATETRLKGEYSAMNQIASSRMANQESQVKSLRQHIDELETARSSLEQDVADSRTALEKQRAETNLLISKKEHDHLLDIQRLTEENQQRLRAAVLRFHRFCYTERLGAAAGGAGSSCKNRTPGNESAAADTQVICVRIVPKVRK